jgi:hypothetical protein
MRHLSQLADDHVCCGFRHSGRESDRLSRPSWAALAGNARGDRIPGRRHCDHSCLGAGDVMDLEQIGPATSRWTIQGPLGIRAHWTIRVTEERTNELIRYETVGLSGLRTYWEVHFTRGAAAGEKEVREVMKAPPLVATPKSCTIRKTHPRPFPRAKLPLSR